MAMTLNSWRGKATPTAEPLDDTPPSRAQLVAELATCTLDDGRCKELERAVKTAEAALEAARKAWHLENAARWAKSSQDTIRRAQITSLLIASAPAEISSAIAELETQIKLARESYKYSETNGMNKSNSASINAFATAAQTAVIALDALRLSPLEGKPLGREIARILRSVPKLNLEVVEVKR